MIDIKKKLLIPLAMTSVLVLTACGGGSGPDRTVNSFMSSYKSLNLEEAGKYIARDLKEEYEDVLEEESDGLEVENMKDHDGFKDLENSFKRLTKEMKYEITDTKIDGSLAEIKVDLTYADASQPLMASIGEIFGQLMGMAFSGEEMTEEESEERLYDILINTVTKSVNDYEIKTEDAKGFITLSKEDGEWLITEIDDKTMNALLFGLTEGFSNDDFFEEMTL